MKFFLIFFIIFCLFGAESSVESGTESNIVSSADFIPKSRTLQFKNITQNITQNIASYAISEKFDGIFGAWDGKEMHSKRGNKIAIPSCFAEKLAVLNLQKGEFVEGELWIDYGAFEELSSVTRRKNPSCADFERVKYLIFNAHLVESRDFLANLNHIKNTINRYKNHKSSAIQIISQHAFSSEKELWDFFNAIIKKGGEGVIVRDSISAYKLKAQNDAECKIIDFSRGKGRLTGKVGAIVCKSLEDKNSGITKGKIFRIGSGLSDEFRANPPKIGTIITYKFSGLSKNGIPKHTRFLRIYNEN